MKMRLVTLSLLLFLSLAQGNNPFSPEFQPQNGPTPSPAPIPNQNQPSTSPNIVGTNRNINQAGSNPSTSDPGTANPGTPANRNGNSNPSASIETLFNIWFNQYRSKFGLTNQEYGYRRTIFVQNYQRIQNHNNDANRNFTMGINQFSGLTLAQFESYSFGQFSNEPNAVVDNSFPNPEPNPDGIVRQRTIPTRQPIRQPTTPTFTQPVRQPTTPTTPTFTQPIRQPQTQPFTQPIRQPTTQPPSQQPPQPPGGIIPQRLLQQNFLNYLGWNWQGVEGALSPVKDQGICGSCYSFAAVAAAESAILISKGYFNVDLSEQQIIDCTGRFGNGGCKGGYKDRSLRYIQQFGLVAEKTYPYGQIRNNICNYSKGTFKVSRVMMVNGCANLRKAVRKAPIAVSLYAGGENWKNYESGILSCPNDAEINHAVLLVGYTSQLHWIVKNSWGTTWGEKGYAKIDVLQNCNICKKIGVQAFL